MKKGFINSYSDFAFIIILVTLSLFLISVAFYNYQHFQFTADIFRHFTTIRNIYEGAGPYESPVQQYIFGTHTYLIFYLISPLLIIYKDPKILLLINILCIASSSYLIYVISKKIFGIYDKSNLKSLLIAISYLFFPIIFKGYFFQPYGFQPDTIATPLFLLMFYFFLNNRFFYFLIVSILILSIKEEFLLIYPALVLFILILNNIFNLNGIKLNRNKLISLLLVYFICLAIIVYILLHYTSLNNSDYLPAFWNSSSFSFELIYEFFFKFLKILFPILPILLIFLYLNNFDQKNFFIIGIILIATFLRLLENVIIYGTPNGSAWGNLILAPIFFICIILIIKRYFEKENSKFYYFLIGIFLIIFISTINNYHATPSIFQSVDYFKNKNNSKLISETKSIKEKIIKKGKLDYIILPEYLLYPFVEEMGYVSIHHIEKVAKDIKKKNKLIFNSSYVVIFKSSKTKLINQVHAPSPDFIKSVKIYKKKIFETKNLELYK